MTFSEMENAIEEARTTLDRADTAARRLARLMVGRLRKVDRSVLRDLKMELRRFNAHTRTWSE